MMTVKRGEERTAHRYVLAEERPQARIASGIEHELNAAHSGPGIIQVRIAPAGRACWRRQSEIEACFLLVVTRILTVTGSPVERMPLEVSGESNRIGLVADARRRSRLGKRLARDDRHEEQYETGCQLHLQVVAI